MATDPFTTIGCAAAALQFLDFTNRTCARVLHLYSKPTSSPLLSRGNSMAVAATELHNFSCMLQDRDRLSGKGKISNSINNSTKTNEEAIDGLVFNCAGAATELSTIFATLAEIQQRTSNSTSAVAKTVKAMKEAWRQDEILYLTKQLETYQRQLVLRILWRLDSMTGNNTNQAEPGSEKPRPRFDLDVLERNVSQIAEVIAVVQQQQHKHTETLAAIITLVNGDTRFLFPKKNISETAFGKVDEGGNVPQKVIRFGAEADSKETRAKVFDFSPVQDEILRCLESNKSSGDRIGRLGEVYDGTFQWLYSSPSGATQMTPFEEWLEGNDASTTVNHNDDNIYWINGAAGSGKSTLMRYIASHPATKTTLQKWAAARELPTSEKSNQQEQQDQIFANDVVCASHSFHSSHLFSSSPVSASRPRNINHYRTELLSSLLHSVLSQRRNLIASVMPELWWAGVTMAYDRQLDTPTQGELERWFRRLLQGSLASGLRLLFLLDGVDECDGSGEEVIGTIKSLGLGSSNVKVVVASRPAKVCYEGFAGMNGLRLEDLTAGDVRLYCQGWLGESICIRFGDAVFYEVVERIVKKSGGVFLWAVLAVQSLVTDLQSHLAPYLGITGEEILWRLDQLPDGLDHLYGALLGRMDNVCRTQASELFQLVILAREAQLEPGKQLSTFQMHYAIAIDTVLDEGAVGDPEMSQQAKSQMTESVVNWINSRCAGLLEVSHANLWGESRSSVDFVHRTALEFLRQPQVWAGMIELTSKSGFHPAVGISRSWVAICKQSPVETTIDLDKSPIWHHTDRALRYASLAEAEGKPVSPHLLCKLDEIMTEHWNLSSHCKYASEEVFTTGHWTSGYELVLRDGGAIINDKRHPATRLYHASRPYSFYSLIVHHCLTAFIQARPPPTSASTPVSSTANNPIHLSRSPSPSSSRSRMSRSPSSLSFSLASPTPTFSHASSLLWDATRNLLIHKPWPARDQEGSAMRCASLCSVLIASGADPNVPIGLDRESAWATVLAYCAVQAQRKRLFQEGFGGDGGDEGVDKGAGSTTMARIFSNLLVTFVQHGADVNAVVSRDYRFEDRIHGGKGVRYSALKMVDTLFSEVVSGNEEGDEGQVVDPYCMSAYLEPSTPSLPPWSGRRSSSRSGGWDGTGEVKAFHRYITGFMEDRGAVSKVWNANETPPESPYGKYYSHSREASSSGGSKMLLVPGQRQTGFDEGDSDSSQNLNKRSSLRRLGSALSGWRRSPRSSVELSRP